MCAEFENEPHNGQLKKSVGFICSSVFNCQKFVALLREIESDFIMLI
jgi:hypothetical protein